MQKLLAGLLIVAVGAGAYFLLRKKNQPTPSEDVNKQWIIGKWKPDSIRLAKDDTLSDLETSGFAADTSFKQYAYEFFPDSSMIRIHQGTFRTDTFYYRFQNDKAIGLHHFQKDSAAHYFNVENLGKTRMLLQAKDSSVIRFNRVD